MNFICATIIDKTGALFSVSISEAPIPRNVLITSDDDLVHISIGVCLPVNDALSIDADTLRKCIRVTGKPGAWQARIGWPNNKPLGKVYQAHCIYEDALLHAAEHGCDGHDPAVSKWLHKCLPHQITDHWAEDLARAELHPVIARKIEKRWQNRIDRALSVGDAIAVVERVKEIKRLKPKAEKVAARKARKAEGHAKRRARIAEHTARQKAKAAKKLARAIEKLKGNKPAKPETKKPQVNDKPKGKK